MRRLLKRNRQWAVRLHVIEAVERRVLLAAGALDPAFGGGDGVARMNFNGNDAALAMAVQGDGRIVVAGNRSPAFPGNEFAVVARYTAQGNRDRSFGPGGDEGDGVIVDPRLTARAVAVAPDRKIVVAGSANEGGVPQIAVARYNPDGTPDTTFGGGDGLAITPLGESGSGAADVTVLTGGRILVAATADFQAPEPPTRHDFAVLRYSADGRLDPSFGAGGSGVVTTDFRMASGPSDVASALAVIAGGKILVCGAAGRSLGVARYNPDGTPDAGFGFGGRVTTDLPATAWGADLVVSPGGDGFFVAGSVSLGDATPGAEQVLVASYLPDGYLNWLVTTPAGSRASGWGIDVAPDGKLVVAGWTAAGDALNNDFLLARYLTDGTLDNTFGDGDGLVTTDVGGPDDQAAAVKVLYGSGLIHARGGRAVAAGLR